MRGSVVGLALHISPWVYIPHGGDVKGSRPFEREEPAEARSAPCIM
jgi:hypothetical protein